MSPNTPSFLLAGALLVLMALSNTVLKRMPISAAVLYLLAGIAVGPSGLGLLRLDPARDGALLEVLSEVAVTVSLFTAGMKLGPPLSDGRWWIPVRLATASMALTVGLIALAGVFLLGLPPGAAVLLGAILAPTDPVLASDVAVEHYEDRDRLRFGLSGEAAMNDGTAFPFVMLGLGLLGLHDLGGGGWWWRWLTVDVLWAVAAGLGSGYGMGWLVARLVLYLRQEHREAMGRDEFLTLGLIALSYGVALLLHSYGFLAVFAAGLALRRTERREGAAVPADRAESPPDHVAGAVLSFNEQLERLGEMTLVLLAGGMLGGVLAAGLLPDAALWFVPLLFAFIRPAAVLLGLLGSRTGRDQRALISWFGIRGIGSIYYLTYAINHGLPEPLARQITGLVFATIAASVFVHGISVTPLMAWYQKRHVRGSGGG